MPRPHRLLVEIGAGRESRWDGKEPDRLLASAREHRMAGLLWSTAERTGVADDGYLADALSALDLRYWARQSVLRNSLSKISHRLSQAGIEVAVLKGIPAEDRWYDRVGERPSQDIDLLLAPHHLHEVDAIIETLQPGHVLVGSARPLVSSQRLPEIELWVENVPVDLHFDLLGLGPFVRHPGAVWEQLISHDLGDGQSVRILNPELSIVNFVIHVNRDSFRRLLGFVDVVRILQRSPIDWPTAQRFIQREGIETLFNESIRMIQDDLGVRVYAPAKSRTWRSRLHRHIWDTDVRLLGDEVKARFPRRQFWQPFLVRKGLVAATAWWLRRLIPPPSLVRYYQVAEGEAPTGFIQGVTLQRLRRLISRTRARKLRRGGVGSPGKPLGTDLRSRDP